MIFVNYGTNIIFLIGITAFIGRVQALSCFQCDSVTNANCSDSLSFMSFSGIEREYCIPPRESSGKPEDNLQSACKKLVLKEGGIKRVIRKCGYEYGFSITEKVENNNHTAPIYIYSCPWDLCNTGNLVKRPSWILSFIVTVLLSKLFM